MRQVDWLSLCRLCLGVGGKLTHISDTCSIPEVTVADFITELLQFEVSEGDEYSQGVCLECLNKLEEFKWFKQECEKNKDVLDHPSARKRRANEDLREGEMSCDAIECGVSYGEDDAQVSIDLDENEIKMKTEPEESDTDSSVISSDEVNESIEYDVFIPLKCQREDSRRTTETTKPIDILGTVSVDELQRLKSSELSVQEKVSIMRRGRSTPDIQVSQSRTSDNKKCIRSFNSEWYQRKSWLCGCETRSALFCFPCLLFGRDATWTRDGFKNINRMKEMTEKHEKSKNHIDSMVSMTLLDNVNVDEPRKSIPEHNIKVRKNREILSKIMDCIILSGNFSTPYNGLKNDSTKGAVFKELLNFASHFDADLRNHLGNNPVFKSVSETVQDGILDCLLQVYREEIRKEVKEADYVAVMAEDVTDVSEFTQMVIVLRYVLNGEVCERFWGFFTPMNEMVDGVARCAMEQLGLVLQGDALKLIAQTFEGKYILKREVDVIEGIIRGSYSDAHFVHSYSHEVDTFLRKAASYSRSARIFFSNLMAIPTFFSVSPNCAAVLERYMSLTFLYSFSEWSSYNIWTIKGIHGNLLSVKNSLIEVQSTSNVAKTVAQATGILEYMDGEDFMFWLELFNQLASRVEVIYNEIKSQDLDVYKVEDQLYDLNITPEKLIPKYCQNASMALVSEARDVCDWLCLDLMRQYSSLSHVAAASFFNKKSFPILKEERQLRELELISEAYHTIDSEKLEAELRVFYCRSEMHKYNNLVELLKYIRENNLDGVLSEMTNLIKIVLTTPMRAPETGSCVSMMTRIKRFLRNAVNPERLNSYAVLSLEGNFLAAHPEMKDKAVNLLVESKSRCADFVFK